MTYPLTFAIQFLLFTLIFIFFLSSKANQLLRSKKTYQRALICLLLLQIVSAALLQKEVGDVMLFSGAGWHLRHKIDYYFIDSDHSMYPFFPFLIFLYAPLNLLTELIPFLTFSFYLKLFLLAALYYLGSKIKSKPAQLQFLSSPLTYSIILFHGQTDVVVLAFLVLAMSSRKIVSQSLSLAAAIATKTWPVLLLPLFILKLKGKSMVLSVFIILTFLFIDVFIYTRYVFGSGFRVVLPAVIKAGGPVGQWGWTYLLSFIKGFHIWFPPLALPLFILLYPPGLLLILKTKQSFSLKLILNLLLIYLLLPKWGIQYLFWLFPLLFITQLIKHLPLKNLYLILTSVYLFLNYLNVAVGSPLISSKIISPLGFCLWLLFAYWFKFLLLLPATPPARVRFLSG